MSELSPYSFVGTPVDKVNNAIEFKDSMFPRSYERIFFKDSVYNFYPHGEIFFKDEVGTAINQVFFVEGMEWNFKLGSNTQQIKRSGRTEAVGYLDHNYVWSESQFFKDRMATHLSGIQVFILISSMYMKDTFKSRITWSKKISDVVRTTIKDYGTIDSSKVFISETKGVDYWPQFNRLNKEFLNNLSLAAFQESKSAFLTFFNCNGEFYFMSLDDLFKQTSIGTYALKFETANVTDDYAIQDYKIIDGGLPINKMNYQNTVYALKSDGTIYQTEANLKDYYLRPEAKGNFLVRNKYITDKHRYVNLGIWETNDREIVLGKTNNLFLNSNLSYGIEIVIRFNPKAVTGKIINIEIDKPDVGSKMMEYGGKWLICESQHVCYEEGVPTSRLMLARPSINVSQKNPFVGEFL